MGYNFSIMPLIAPKIDNAAEDGVAKLMMMMLHGMHSSRANDLVSSQAHAGHTHDPYEWEDSAVPEAYLCRNIVC